jgi:multiple sugar transport system substrate-binding protein
MKIGGTRSTWVLMFISILLLLVIGSIAVIKDGMNPSETVIRFGMSAGSYWDVPTGNCYEVIDDAIERFEASHPGVRVEYVSGILKDDYPEWLSEQIVLGKEPDVFMIPESEFDTIASLNVLKDLDYLI